jgi:hypothetical protein
VLLILHHFSPVPIRIQCQGFCRGSGLISIELHYYQPHESVGVRSKSVSTFSVLNCKKTFFLRSSQVLLFRLLFADCLSFQLEVFREDSSNVGVRTDNSKEEKEEIDIKYKKSVYGHRVWMTEEEVAVECQHDCNIKRFERVSSTRDEDSEGILRFIRLCNERGEDL